MATWIRANQAGAMLVATLIVGLLFVCFGLFLVGCVAGFIGSGVLVIAAGHWVTYLNGRGGVR